jgi:ABC-type uncharacterized transport system substrate-binding protein
MAGQWLDLLKEIAPHVERVLVIFNPETSPQSKLFLNTIGSAAPSLGVEVVPAPVRDAAEIEQAIERYVDQILKGASPKDLPIGQPNKLALIINLKTAKALGLTVPAQLIARAAEAID